MAYNLTNSGLTFVSGGEFGTDAATSPSGVKGYAYCAAGAGPLPASGPITIQCFAKRTAYNSTNAVIYSQYNFVQLFQLPSGDYGVVAGSNGNANSTVAGNKSGIDHLRVVFDTNGTTLSVNGAPAVTAPAISASSPSTANRFMIGDIDTAQGGQYNWTDGGVGFIQDVEVFNTALPTTYTVPTAPTAQGTAGLVARYLLSSDFTDTSGAPAAAPLIDGTNSASGTSASTYTLTISTTQANDVLILASGTNVATGTASITAISDTAGLIWTKRASSAIANTLSFVETWFAIAANPLTGNTITVTLSQTAAGYQGIVFAVSGRNTTAPFDTNSSLPAIPAENTAPAVSTTAASAFIFGVIRSGGAANVSPGSGFTQINGTVLPLLAEYLNATSAQSSLALTYNSSAQYNQGIGDVLVAAGENGVTGTGTPPPPTNTTIAMNNAAIVYSPYNWGQIAEGAKSVNPGANFRLLFTGNSFALKFDTSANDTTVPLPQIAVRIDGQAWQVFTVAPTITVQMPANTTQFLHHFAEVWFKSCDLFVNRWNPQAAAIIVTGIVLDANAVVEAPVALPKNILFLGSSYVEGTNAFYGGSDTNELDVCDARFGYPAITARDLGAEPGIAGFSGTGVSVAANVNNGYTPPLTQTYNYLWSGVSRSFSPAPDLILVDGTTNDSSFTAATEQANLQTVLSGLLGLTPSTTPIVVLETFTGDFASAAQAAVAAMNNGRVTYQSTSGFIDTVNDFSGLHPEGPITCASLGPKIANAVRSLVYSGSSSSGGGGGGGGPHVQSRFGGVKKGASQVIVPVLLKDGSGNPKTGLNASGISAAYFQNNAAAVTPITLVAGTKGTYVAGGVVEMDSVEAPGWYQVCPPDAAWQDVPGTARALILRIGGAGLTDCEMEIPLGVIDPPSYPDGALPGIVGPGATASLIPAVWRKSGIAASGLTGSAIIMTSGALNGLRRTIASESANTLLVAAFPAAPAQGDSFVVY